MALVEAAAEFHPDGLWQRCVVRLSPSINPRTLTQDSVLVMFGGCNLLHFLADTRTRTTPAWEPSESWIFDLMLQAREDTRLDVVTASDTLGKSENDREISLTARWRNPKVASVLRRRPCGRVIPHRRMLAHYVACLLS
jgi:hypothetical protein